MNRSNESTDEEKSVLAFLETHFERCCMLSALAMLRNVDTKAGDLRAVMDAYRWLYQNERQ